MFQENSFNSCQLLGLFLVLGSIVSVHYFFTLFVSFACSCRFLQTSLLTSTLSSPQCHVTGLSITPITCLSLTTVHLHMQVCVCDWTGVRVYNSVRPQKLCWKHLEIHCTSEMISVRLNVVDLLRQIFRWQESSVAYLHCITYC